MKSLRLDFGRRRLVSTLATGIILGIVNTLLGIALISLIFQGQLAEFLPVGIGLVLAASLAVAVVTAVGSTVGGLYAGVQDASTAILGLAALSVVAAGAAATLDTVIAMMIVTSLGTGLVLVLMGRFRVGEISRYLPFPLIGGLLAGTGYLIVIGSVEILGGVGRHSMLGTGSTGLFWPGVILALSFFVASRRKWRSGWYFWMLLGGVGVFHVVLRLLGVSRATASANGWLLGPFPEGSLWPGLAFRSLFEADWGAVVAQLPAMITVLFIVPMSVVLYISALEVERRRDIDVGAELQVMGWANVASGMVGGPPGYIYLADTVVMGRLVGYRRGPALVAALTLGVVLSIGSTILEFVPTFVVGGLLLFVGIDFLVEWLWESRRRMAPGDYLLMVGIVVLVATVGFLVGVAAGLVAAILLFVIRYSHIDVVKHSLTASEYPSNIERSPATAELLTTLGDSVAVLFLQGFIFFGTSNQIMARVRSRLVGPTTLKFVVIDFRMVSGIDSSALAIFERLCLLAQEHDFFVVLTGLAPAQSTQFDELKKQFEEHLTIESDVDRGVAWCEEQLLAVAAPADDSKRSLPEDLSTRLAPYMVGTTVEAGTRLIEQGAAASGLYIIVEGRASVLLVGDDGKEMRIRTLLEGTLIGEISLYHDEPATATVVTETACELLQLSVESFDLICESNPRLAADLHAFVATTLASRVSHANRTIRALHR